MQLDKRLADKEWRMQFLYRIINKDTQKVTFKPNEAQRHFNENKHTRNILLKSRQLGFSTYECIDSLDDVLFTPNFSASIINYEQKEAIKMFDNKIKLAWDNLPDAIKALYELNTERRNMLRLGFGDKSYSSIDVVQSARGTTSTRIHITELAKMARNYPKNAIEIITGTIPSVPLVGRVDIESTAEGSDGIFYDMFMEAWNRNRDPLPMEFKAHFYNWRWDKEDIARKVKVPIPFKQMDNGPLFEDYQKKHELTDIEITYYYLTWLSVNKDWNKMRQEFPTCVVGNTLVGTKTGYRKIKDIELDDEILNKFDQGEKQVYRLTTKMGYELVCTEDHPILTKRGFVELKDLKEDDVVILRGAGFGKNIQKVKYKNFITDCEVKINKRLALFLGIFMGDGSLSGDTGTISIACDKECQDVVKVVEDLIDELFGGHSSRTTGSKMGCLEVRKSNKKFVDIFNNLGILRKNTSGNYKRKICVPDYIKNSPKPIVREFLKGLIEADGFAARKGHSVKFFSKYKEFIQDVQLLLLNFGITSYLRTAVKKAGNGNEYIGYELTLRKEESSIFKKEIGFISKKKNDRLKLNKGTCQVILEDSIKSVVKEGIEKVYDITTDTHEFSANGIVVHNCVEEAFEGSGYKMFDQVALDKMRTGLREGTVFEDWIFYAPYIDSHTYAVGVDVGQGIGLDSSTIVILDVSGDKASIVAEYASNKIEPDLLAYEIVRGAQRYGNPIVGVERNNVGHTTLTILKGIYPNVYTEVMEDKVADTVTEKLGWHTNQYTKPKMMYELSDAIRDDLLYFPSKYIYEELRTYDKEDVRQISFNPNQSRHWDRLIALAIAWQMKAFAYQQDDIEIITHHNERY